MKTTAFLSCASAALLASTANAQVASAMLREGDALTGPLAGQTVTSINGASANDNGGFVILDFTGSSTVGLGSNSIVYFTADIDVMGSTLEGLFAYAVATDYPTFCFGDSAGNLCLCGNQGAPGEGCANSTGMGMIASASGDAVVGSDTLVLTAMQCPANVPGVFFQGNSALANPGFLGDGLLCISGGIQRLGTTFVDGSGVMVSNPQISVLGGVSPGDTRYYQLWTRDNQGPCGLQSNTSNGVQVDWQ